MSRSGREALPDVWEWSGGPHNVRERSGGPPGCLGVVGRPSRCLEVVGRLTRVVGRPSQMSGSGREALLDVREW